MAASAAATVPSLAGCQTAPTQIVSEPSEAVITVNGNNLGNSPVSYLFDFGREPSIEVQAVKTGYFTEQALLTGSDNSKIKDGRLLLRLDEDESYLATTTSEATNSWLRIQADAGLDKEAVWQRIVDAVTSRYPGMEMMDVVSGYVRSVYSNRKFKSRRGDFEVRTRFVGTIANRDPLTYKLRLDSDIRANAEDWRPFSRVFREDQQMVEEIQSRLGMK